MERTLVHFKEKEILVFLNVYHIFMYVCGWVGMIRMFSKN